MFDAGVPLARNDCFVTALDLPVRLRMVRLADNMPQFKRSARRFKRLTELRAAGFQEKIEFSMWFYSSIEKQCFSIRSLHLRRSDCPYELPVAVLKYNTKRVSVYLSRQWTEYVHSPELDESPLC